MAACLLTDKIEAALARYEAKFAKEYPLELLAGYDEEDQIVQAIERQITSGKPIRRRRNPRADY